MKACPYCAEQIQDAATICRFCQRAVASGAPMSMTTAPQALRTWSPGVAAVLSFFIPGLGQLYKGHIARGLVLFVITILGYMMLVLPGLAIHIGVIWDAYNGRTREEERAADLERYTAEERENIRRSNARQLRVGLALVGGLVLLAAVLGQLLPRTTTRELDPEASADGESLDWQRRLQHIVASSGEPCERVTEAFHQGSRHDGNFWNVRCSGRESYAITLKTGEPPRVLSCTLLKRVAKVDCFTRF